MVILVVYFAWLHLSCIVYLSFVQASLTSDIYPIHYGCRCILLPINLKWLQPLADDHRTQPLAKYNGWVLTDVLLFTHLVHLPKAYASKPILWIYALRRLKDISLWLWSFKNLFASICCRQREVSGYGIGYQACLNRQSYKR